MNIKRHTRLALITTLFALPTTDAFAGGNGLNIYVGADYSSKHITAHHLSSAGAYAAPGIGSGSATNDALITTTGSNTKVATKGITQANGHATNTSGVGHGQALLMSRVLSGGQRYSYVSAVTANANDKGASGSGAVRAKAW